MDKSDQSWYDGDDLIEVEENLDFDEHEKLKKIRKTNVQCSKCKKVLSNKTSLNTHLLSVRPCIIPKPPRKTTRVEKPAQCPECQKVFTQETNMKIHLKSIHQGIKLKCEYCGKTATNKSNLKKHIRLSCPSKPLRIK